MRMSQKHYAKKTLNWLTVENMPYVPKKDNPSNVLQALYQVYKYETGNDIYVSLGKTIRSVKPNH